MPDDVDPPPDDVAPPPPLVEWVGVTVWVGVELTVGAELCVAPEETDVLATDELLLDAGVVLVGVVFFLGLGFAGGA